MMIFWSTKILDPNFGLHLLQEVQHCQKWQVLSAPWWKVMVGFQIRDLVIVALFFYFSFFFGCRQFLRSLKPARWWFELFLIFTPYPGEMMNFIHFDEHIFQMGWFNHQLVQHNYLTELKQKGKISILRSDGCYPHTVTPGKVRDPLTKVLFELFFFPRVK